MQFCIGMGDLISDVNDKPQIHLVNFANFFFFFWWAMFNSAHWNES